MLDIESILWRYRPLVIATARRYTGRGAEFDDLVQEGYMALILLIPLCPAPERLPAYLKSRLPGRVRTAAQRSWRTRERTTALEGLEGTAKEPRVNPSTSYDALIDLKAALASRRLNAEDH